MNDEPPELKPEEILRRGIHHDGQRATHFTAIAEGGFRIHIDFDEFLIRYVATEAGQMGGDSPLGVIFRTAYREHPEAMRVEVTFHFDPPEASPADE